MVTPLPLEHSPWRASRWLVLAPHPDDETLGAGGLIAHLAGLGRPAQVVFLTDGAGSHDCDTPARAARLAALRRSEARRALSRLGAGAGPPPVFLDWPDARPHDPGSLAWSLARRRLSALCRLRGVDALAVTAADDPHCDHAAAAALARSAARLSRRPVRLFDYVVWGRTPATGARLCVSVPQGAPGRLAHALSAHRSQLTPLAGPGFRLQTPRGFGRARLRLYTDRPGHAL